MSTPNPALIEIALPQVKGLHERFLRVEYDRVLSEDAFQSGVEGVDVESRIHMARTFERWAR